MSPRRRALDFASVLFTTFVLIPAGAHLLELPNKLQLDARQYLIAQRSYDGWWLVGMVIPIALVLLALRAWLRFRAGEPYKAALLSFLSVASAHAIFWLFTFPANVASANWTRLPEDFERVRAHWEWSHAAGALLDLTGLCALLVSILYAPALRSGASTRKPGRENPAGLYAIGSSDRRRPRSYMSK